MEKITYDNLPEAVTRIDHKLTKLEQLIIEHRTPTPDAWFDIEGARQYLPNKPAKATLYKWVRERKVPYHKKGKNLAF